MVIFTAHVPEKSDEKRGFGVWNELLDLTDGGSVRFELSHMI